MAWITIILGYLLGAIPTAYIAGHIFKNVDIRRTGDANMGAANAFRELGPAVGIAVGLVDAGKGALAIVIAQAVGVAQLAVLFAGAACVIGHNWPVFTGFRGGRGESTTIGILFALLTQPMLIMTTPTIAVLLISKNVILTSAFLFIPLPFLCWWLGVPGLLIGYSIALPCLVAVTHFLRTRPIARHV